MSAHSHEEISKHVRVYLFVFLALLIGTVVTVGLNYLHFDSVALTVTIALFVAVVKATLVACYFMHLISEKKLIYVVLIVTAVFFLALMALPVLTTNDGYGIHQ